MAGTDQCYMHLKYLGNTDVVSVQISKVHSHDGSTACCQLLSIELYSMTEQHYGESKTNVSTFDMLSSAYQLDR